MSERLIEILEKLHCRAYEGSNDVEDVAQAELQIKQLIKGKMPKQYTDYPQCCVGGHNELNCAQNIIAKTKFETHNKIISLITKLIDDL